MLLLLQQAAGVDSGWGTQVGLQAGRTGIAMWRSVDCRALSGSSSATRAEAACVHVAHRDQQRVKELAFALRRGSIGKARRAGAGGLRGMAGGGEPGSPMRLESQEEDGGSWPPLYGRRPPQVGVMRCTC